MVTEQAIEFLKSIEGKTVYSVAIINDKVESGVYNPVTFDKEYLEQITDELLEGLIELKTWQHRHMRNFEHYVLYFNVN